MSSKLCRVALAGGLLVAMGLAGRGVSAVSVAPTARVLRPRVDNPLADAAIAQAFGDQHDGLNALAHPQQVSAVIAAGAAAARAVPAARSASLDGPWTLRGPSTLYANDPTKDATVYAEGFQTLSGRVTTIATTPAAPHLVYAGAADGGVWRSTDAGAHWTPIFDSQSTLAIGSIAIDPADASRVYVGTGEPNTNQDAFYGDGIYVSNDYGDHWSHVYLPGVLTVFHVEAAAPSPGFPDGRVFVATNDGLYLSTNHGTSYHNVSLPTNAAHTAPYTGSPFGNFVTDVRVRPEHPDEVLAVVGWRRGAGLNANGQPDSEGNGFYKSLASGTTGTFQFLPQVEPSGLGVPGNDANPFGSSDPIGRTSIAYSADGKYLWAVVQDAGNFRGETYFGEPLPANNSILNGVYLSPDASATDWVPKGNVETFGTAAGTGLLVEQGLLYGPGVQSWYNQWIAVDPADDSRVLVGLEEVYEAVANATTPSGFATWRTVARYWNTCAGVTLSCSTVPGPVYSGNTTHPDQHGVAFVPQPGGVTRLYTGSDGGVFAQDSHVTDLGYTGYDNSSWSYLNTGLATTQPYYAVEASDGTIYAGLQDNGEEKISPGGTRGDEIDGGDGFDTAVVPNNSQIVYEEYTYGETAVSTNGGSSWFSDYPCDAGTSTLYQFATPFQLDPKNANHIVIAGNVIHESTKGVNTNTENQENCTVNGQGVFQDWSNTYSLGPSVVANNPEVSGAGVNNVASALAVQGADMYVPFCGTCDPITQAQGDFADFHNGMATNVTPGCTAVIGSGACWRKASILGLPNRYIQGVAMDPIHPQTVYVVLTGYARHWYPSSAAGGHVYVSYDA
ncbi:MAG: WD40/YVTN/BNR-like repeat-containing protein, partial [Mycobacteriales bacterium]